MRGEVLVRRQRGGVVMHQTSNVCHGRNVCVDTSRPRATKYFAWTARAEFSGQALKRVVYVNYTSNLAKWYGLQPVLCPNIHVWCPQGI